MRTRLIGSVAIMLVLAGCNVKDKDAQNRLQSESKQPASWSGRTIKQLKDAIDARTVHALDRVSFEPMGDNDQQRTRLALAYASALAKGATDPTKLYDIYTVARPTPDLQEGLASALRAGDLISWLEGLAPGDAHYRRLSEAYVKLQRRSATPAPTIPDAGEPIKPGATDARLFVIAKQLVLLDYLEERSAAGGAYTPEMVAAVTQMQSDYGMKPDGIIGTEALAILNISDIDRARAIAVAMERLRWLERNAPPTRIDVNLAAARLTYWRDGKIVDSRRVVVGETDKETPQLQSPIFRLVANPTWTVPRSIQAKELAGKGGGYLHANNMAWKDGWIVQKSGPKNSLGLVKFDMQNDHAIYLHDTPAKPLFAMAQRQRSHGCVRVEDALGFAEMLARDEGVLQQWREAQATGKESFVRLPRQIPVRMLYQTVLFDDAGEPIVRNDPYGWDDRVGAALGFKAGRALRVQTDQTDVGP